VLAAWSGVPSGDFLTAAATPPIFVDDPTRQHRPVGLHALPGHLQPELIKAAEGGQLSAGEARTTGSVVHVEVFQMVGLGTSIFGRPRLLPRQQRADPLYTLNCEEPVSRYGDDPDEISWRI
jgi:hypothetical protein